MKRFFVGIVLLLFSPVLFAQNADLFWSMLGIINDKDGYTNVREEASVSSPIQGKVYSHQVFYIPDFADPSNNMQEIWYSVGYEKINNSYSLSETTNSGYIHSSRILPLTKINRLSKRTLSDNRLILSNDSISVIFTEEPFNEADHTIKRHPEGWLAAIDGQNPWGTDGTMPETSLASISISYKNEIYSLPKAALSKVYELSFAEDRCGVFIDRDNALYIVMVNGDGAGAYLAIWTIVDKKLETMSLMIPF